MDFIILLAFAVIAITSITLACLYNIYESLKVTVDNLRNDLKNNTTIVHVINFYYIILLKLKSKIIIFKF